jgi:hypothetical protein
MKGRAIRYTDDELAWIEAHAHLPRREMHARFVARFDRPVISQANLASLCKRKGWLTGRTGRFQAGQPSWNKGREMPSHPNSRRTQFKPGGVPHTFRGPGHESICKDGYVWIIVAERNPHTGAATRRVMKHRRLWEQRHGPLPEGHCLKCLDGDKTNTDPENWACVPRALLPRLNGRFGRDYDSAPAELKPLILQIARLEHAARTRRQAKTRKAK